MHEAETAKVHLPSHYHRQKCRTEGPLPKAFSSVRKSAPSPHGIKGAQGSVSSPMRVVVGHTFLHDRCFTSLVV